MKGLKTESKNQVQWPSFIKCVYVRTKKKGLCSYPYADQQGSVCILMEDTLKSRTESELVYVSVISEGAWYSEGNLSMAEN